MRRTLYFLLLLSFLYSMRANAAIPADISFLVIDLKYNERDGVKICEVQQGLGSVFDGVKFLSKQKGLIAKKFAEVLSRYSETFWYSSLGISSEFLPYFIEAPNWKGFKRFQSLSKDKKFRKKAKQPVKDAASLEAYHGMIVSHYQYLDMKLMEKFPGILVLNEAFLSSFGSDMYSDKASMSRLFEGSEKLERLKPKWKLYEKKYSEGLSKKILNDFTTDYLVIKPIVGFQGKGVIILKREELDKTLRNILNVTDTLRRDRDKSYSHWAYDIQQDFIVEEFYPSTPVQAPHLSKDLYDGTIRVPVVLTYHKGEIDLHFLYCFWKLPPRSLNDQCSLNDKHKSFTLSGVHFCPVDSTAKANIENQLREGLVILYKRLVEG